MKRSKSVALTLMASSAVTVSACGPREPRVNVTPFETVAQCAQDTRFSQDTCDKAYAEALEEHEKSAPRYENQRLCEEEFGVNRCTRPTTSAAGSYFIPFLAGFAVSKILDNSATIGGYGHYSTPIYRTRYGYDYYTPGGYTLRRGGSGYSVGKKAMSTRPKPAKVRSRTSVISRGGFTARSSSYGRGGRGFGG